MTTEEWESLCDNCGKCCLHKLEDEDTGEIAFTSVVCNLIDLDTCRCSQYRDRTRLVPECIDLNNTTSPLTLGYQPPVHIDCLQIVSHYRTGIHWYLEIRKVYETPESASAAMP